MIARKVVQQENVEPTINLTPLIDVVFVVLIMFILIAPLLNLDQVELADGGKDLNESLSLQEKGPIAIHVRKDNSILINQHPVDLSQLPSILKNLHSRYPEKHPQLFHDKEAFFGTYQAVKNATEAAGFEQIDVVLKP